MFLRALLAVCVLTIPAVYAAGTYASGGTDPTFTLDWDDDGTTITFTLSCKGTGWCSVGFNAAGGGISTSDIYMGSVSGGTTTLLDNHNHNDARPTLDGQQDCTVVSSSETGGRTTIEWSRPLNTGDAADDEIITDSNMNIFFAYQATDDNMNTEHTSTGSTTQNLLAEGTGTDDTTDDTQGSQLNAFTSPDGGMGMEWTLDQTAATVTITMYCTSGWVSVGLCASTDINDKTDMWTGWMPSTGTTPMLLDTNSHNQVVPPQDATNNLVIVSGTNANADGKTQIVFTRPLAPTDTADIAITDTSLVVIWAWSNQDGSSATNYPEHGSRGFVSINFFTGEVTEIVLSEIDPAVVLTGFIVGCVGVFVVGRWSYKGYKKWNHTKAKGELGTLSDKTGGPIVNARKMTTRDARTMSSYYRGNSTVEYKKNPWEEATDPNTGATYYYNQDTGESVWTKPAELTSVVVAATHKKEAKTASGHEWEECVDPNSGLSYFYNKRTGCSQWEKPKTDVIDQASDSQDDGGDHHRPLPPPAKSAALKQKQQVWGLLDYRIPYTQVSVLYAIIGVVYFIFNIIFLLYVGRYIVATNWGYLAMANSLFLALPANRNGVLVWLLGLSFDRVIIFHRWLGRWTVFCVSMHMFTYWDIWTNGPVGMAVQFSVVKYHYGWWAWFFGMIVLVTSLEWFRRKHFEWFFYSHFFFFLFYAFGALHTPKYEPYLIAALFFYLLDRLIRVFWGLWPCKSISFEVMEGNLIKIRFPKHPVARMLGLYGVGQYMFINFPGLSLMEWHPFSVANGPREQTMAVYIKGLGDHTTKLIERARSSQDAWMWMRVDGPYGNHRANYRRYPVLLLFGGGVGITPIMGILKDMFNVGDLPAGEQPPPHCVDAVYMMWTMTDEVVFNWFTQELTACQQQAGRNGFPALHLACYVTRAKNVTNPILNTGRPDVAAVFDQVARDHPNKAVTVFACGPAAMVNSAWDKANTMELSGNRFDFHHETFEF